MSERLRTMTDGEIVTSYRQAKDKREQIGILADLNLMTKEKVCEILRAAGIGEVGEAKKTRREPPNVWRDEELDSLRRMCAEGRGLGEISEALGRTRHAVHRKGVSLGLAFCEDVLPGEDVGKKRTNKKWTTGELDSLRRMAAEGKTPAECAEALGRTKTAVMDRGNMLKLSFARSNAAVPGVPRERHASNGWIQAEVSALRRLCAEGKTAAECAEAIGRTKNAVYMRAKALGLSFRRAHAAVKAEKAAPAKAKKAAPKEAIGGDWRSDLTAALAAAEEVAAAKGRVPKNVRILAGGEIATVEICFPGGEEYGVILRGGKEDADVQG